METKTCSLCRRPADKRKMKRWVRLTARAQALESCADHLYLDWTDDPIERCEGLKLSRQLREQAGRIFKSLAAGTHLE
jgi:hypothetical protein